MIEVSPDEALLIDVALGLLIDHGRRQGARPSQLQAIAGLRARFHARPVAPLDATCCTPTPSDPVRTGIRLRQAAELIGKSRQRLNVLALDGRLAAWRDGSGAWLVDEQEVLRMRSGA